jgi:hypothetical protein
VWSRTHCCVSQYWNWVQIKSCFCMTKITFILFDIISNYFCLVKWTTTNSQSHFNLSSQNSSWFLSNCKTQTTSFAQIFLKSFHKNILSWWLIQFILGQLQFGKWCIRWIKQSKNCKNNVSICEKTITRLHWMSSKIKNHYFLYSDLQAYILIAFMLNEI